MSALLAGGAWKLLSFGKRVDDHSFQILEFFAQRFGGAHEEIQFFAFELEALFEGFAPGGGKLLRSFSCGSEYLADLCRIPNRSGREFGNSFHRNFQIEFE